MIRVAAFVLAGIALAFGIVHAQGIKKPGAPLALGKIRLTPVDLFPGDLKRLQPHLGISGVCYKVEYNGPETPARIVLEEWKNGKREGWSSSGLNLKGPLAGEVSISIQSARDDDGNLGSRVIESVQRATSASTTGEHNFSKPQLKQKTFSYKRPIEEASDFNSDGEIALWAVIHVKAGVGADQTKAISDLAKEAEYAIVWKLVPRGNE